VRLLPSLLLSSIARRLATRNCNHGPVDGPIDPEVLPTSNKLGRWFVYVLRESIAREHRETRFAYLGAHASPLCKRRDALRVC
jgi:hypothetical protein